MSNTILKGKFSSKERRETVHVIVFGLLLIAGLLIMLFAPYGPSFIGWMMAAVGSAGIIAYSNE